MVSGVCVLPTCGASFGVGAGKFGNKRSKSARNGVHFVIKRSAMPARLYRAVAPCTAVKLSSDKKESMRGNWDE
jgi:hypothetical protein